MIVFYSIFTGIISGFACEFAIDYVLSLEYVRQPNDFAILMLGLLVSLLDIPMIFHLKQYGDKEKFIQYNAIQTVTGAFVYGILFFISFVIFSLPKKGLYGCFTGLGDENAGLFDYFEKGLFLFFIFIIIMKIVSYFYLYRKKKKI